jgi:hypothetical protein
MKDKLKEIEVIDKIQFFLSSNLSKRGIKEVDYLEDGIRFKYLKYKVNIKIKLDD